MRRTIMNIISNGNRVVNVPMDRILESAVVLSWKDLFHVSQTGLIHIEYAPTLSPPSLKIWQLSGKGEWNLICEYRVLPGSGPTPVAEVAFSNGYHSAALAQMLEVVLQHQ